MSNLRIETSSIYKDFSDHLEIEDNINILFSAPFGTGKTTFLEEFFIEKSNKYNYVHLFPVYYSVSQNEDIFELIKYDVLFGLMLNYKEDINGFNELDFSKKLAMQLYVNQQFNPLDFLQKLAAATSKIGKQVGEVIDIIKQEKQTFDEYYKSLNRTEEDIIKDFIQQFESNKGNIHEFDSISQLIFETLSKLKEGNRTNEVETPKENVLIIDDLDRIDPEHIFRIFNVFSAHQDWKTQKNKFGFDKIIFVCDIENIKQIYLHKYGKGVDFIGYINKFYSKGIYSFNINKLILDRINDILKPITPVDKVDTHRDDHIQKYHLGSNDSYRFSKTITYILSAFLSSNLLDLRSLLSMPKFKIRNYNFYDEIHRGRYNPSIQYDIIVLNQFFENLFGSTTSFKTKMEQLTQTNDANPKYLNFEDSYYDYEWGNWIIEYCLPFLNKHDKKIAVESNLTLSVDYLDYKIYYIINRYSIDYSFSFVKLTDLEGVNQIQLQEFNLLNLLANTLDTMRKKSII